jgi:hypothetical protein
MRHMTASARLCFEMACNSHALSLYNNNVKLASQNVEDVNIERLVKKAAGMVMDDISHKLCLIRRENIHHVPFPVCVMPITLYMQSKLAIALQDKDSCEQIKCYRTFAAVLSFREMSGFVFETFCQNCFQR